MKFDKEYFAVSRIWLYAMIFIIGLTVGATWQAANDVITINKMLNESAKDGTILFDGINYYSVSNYDTYIDIYSQEYVDNLYGNNTFNITEVCTCTT